MSGHSQDVRYDMLLQSSGREPASVVAWRWRRLVAAGFDRDIASDIAADDTWDLHALLELVERGCRPDLALRILSPLDHPVEPR